MDANPASEAHTAISPRVLCVLGMHRSGTSCLTGSLQEAGLFLGDCHTWNPHNLKGNRENQEFVDLNDEILKENSGAWDLPPESVSWSCSHKQRARELLGNNTSQGVFGFKDPRTLLVLDGWKEVNPELEFVGIFRHPDEVARSLAKRGSMEREKALQLWYAYNLILYRQYQDNPFPLLCFDVDEGVLQDKIQRLATRVGLNTGSEQESFYSAELRTERSRDVKPLPWKVRLLYYKLKMKCL